MPGSAKQMKPRLKRPRKQLSSLTKMKRPVKRPTHTVFLLLVILLPLLALVVIIWNQTRKTITAAPLGSSQSSQASQNGTDTSSASPPIQTQTASSADDVTRLAVIIIAIAITILALLLLLIRYLKSKQQFSAKLEEKPAHQSVEKLLREVFGEKYKDARVNTVCNSGGGDCLFLSVAEALRRRDASRTNTQSQKTMSAQKLRSAVADELTKDKLNIFKDRAEFDKNYKPFLTKSLQKAKAFMKTSKYWADEFALGELEKKLGIKIRVIRLQGNEAVESMYGGIKDAEKVMFVQLRDDHYELLTLNGFAIFENIR
jgi:hypothetical protein